MDRWPTETPRAETWETADRYLSGNVRAKLAVAQTAAQIDPAYRRNVEALQAVQPKDLEPGEIEARLGSSWIPPSDVRDFIAELLDVPREERENRIRRDPSRPGQLSWTTAQNTSSATQPPMEPPAFVRPIWSNNR